MSTSGRAHSPALEPAHAERTAAIVAPHLPRALVPLFDARFAHSNALCEEFVFRLTLGVVCDIDGDKALDDWCTVDELMRRSALEPRRAAVPVSWMLRHLARRGVLAQDTAEGLRFRATALGRLDPAPIAVEQRAHDAGCLPSYVLAETAAREYPAFLHGGPGGEQILFAPSRLPLWTSYFSNDHVLYAVNNHVGAVAVDMWMPHQPATILELGGGLASGTSALLEHLDSAGRRDDVQAYRFTEPVPAFLRRGQRLLEQRFASWPPLTYASLDMNQPFTAQGVSPDSVSLVYAVNTLHVASDLAFTLGEVHRALEPGGQLIVSECVRPHPADTLYPEFVFNLLETFRSPRLQPPHRPNGGFLTPEQWTGALEAAGFADVRILPDIVRIRKEFPGFYVAAIGATRPA